MGSENPEWVDDPEIANHAADPNAVYAVDAPLPSKAVENGQEFAVRSETKLEDPAVNLDAMDKTNKRLCKRLMNGYFAPMRESKPFQSAPSGPVFMQACKQPDGKAYEQPGNSPMNYTFRCVIDAK